MDTNKLIDLRFVIGAFFTIVGLLLLIYSFSDGEAVNRWCGIVFILFGVFMILISLQKDAADEILEEEKE
jgi:uncharacterized membrane protein HdeD (DUF308 family)